MALFEGGVLALIGGVALEAVAGGWAWPALACRWILIGLGATLRRCAGSAFFLALGAGVAKVWTAGVVEGPTGLRMSLSMVLMFSDLPLRRVAYFAVILRRPPSMRARESMASVLLTTFARLSGAPALML